MSIQINSNSKLTIYPVSTSTELNLPIVTSGISAGFPSPAMDFIDVSIDLNKHLIKHPSSTFYGRVKGHSMKDASIYDGDLLIIDKSLHPKNNQIAVCFIDGDFTIKRISVNDGHCWLLPENKDYKPIKITEDNDFQIWGVVTYVIKSL